MLGTARVVWAVASGRQGHGDRPVTRTVPVLDVGGTHVTAALVDVDAGRVLRQERAHLDPTGPADALLDAIADPARELGAAHGAEWGIAFPGPFDYAAGIGRFEHVGKFEALADLDVATPLAPLLGTSRERLTFLNDAVAYGLGEWAYGAAAGFDRVLVLTLGTGVGSAFLADGLPVTSGPAVPPRGEAHLIRADDGTHLEDVMSRRALLRAYAARTARTDADVVDIADAVRDGDAEATAVWDAVLTGLGRLLGPYVSAFEPQAVVIGGSIARSFDLIEAPLRAGLGETRAGIALRRARHIDDAPLLGAARQVRPRRA